MVLPLIVSYFVQVERALRDLRAEVEATYVERDQSYCWDLRDEYLEHFLHKDFVTGEAARREGGGTVFLLGDLRDDYLEHYLHKDFLTGEAVGEWGIQLFSPGEMLANNPLSSAASVVPFPQVKNTRRGCARPSSPS